MSDAPPWFVDGLPDRLTAAHLVLAAEVMHDGLAKHIGPDPFTADSLRPVTGDPMVYFRLFGAHYPHNSARLERQWSTTPLATTAKGERTYPVILVSDPTPGSERVVPIGVVGSAGYLGSAYGSAAVELAKRLKRDSTRGRYWVTRFLLARSEEVDADWTAKVWLPGQPYR